VRVVDSGAVPETVSTGVVLKRVKELAAVDRDLIPVSILAMPRTDEIIGRIYDLASSGINVSTPISVTFIVYEEPSAAVR